MRRFLPAIPCFLIVLGAVLFPVLAVAQTPFALESIGQKVDTDDARMMGRGGWGMAVSDSTNPGFKNIAGLSAIRQVAISLVGYAGGTSSEDTSGTRVLNRVMTPEFRLAVPVIKGRLALTAGFSMDRSFRYDTLTEDSTSVRDHDLKILEQFVRQGTLFSVPLGVAVEVVPGLSLGATVGLARGSVTESLWEIFTQPTTITGSPFYQTVLQAQKDTYNGTTQTYSVLASPGKRAAFGASWTPAYDVDVDRTVDLSGLSARYSTSYTLTMADEYMAGAQVNLAGRWWIGADYQLQTFGELGGLMEDEYTFSFGAEKRMAYERRGGLGNLPIRVGFSTRQWAYRVGGNAIEENTVSVGTGFPFRRKLGVLDLAFSYSKVGDLEKNGLEDSVWRMTVSVAGLEKWW